MATSIERGQEPSYESGLSYCYTILAGFAGSSLASERKIYSSEQRSFIRQTTIIHRDIKPESLLLNEHQQVLLSDFGLAVFAPSPDGLSLLDRVGTIPYAAPEQLRGKPVFASDQYALGIIAYEWLCGHRPFEGDDVEVIRQHISVPPPRIRQDQPSIPEAVEDVVLKALAKDPQERFPDVMAFAQALENASQKMNFYFTNNRLHTVDQFRLSNRGYHIISG